MKVGKVADLVDYERAAGTTRRWPARNHRGEHEMVKDKLTAPLEKVEQAHFAFGPIEDVLLVDPDHWQPSPLRGKRVNRAGQRFLFHEQFFSSGLPDGRGNDLRN